MEVLSEALARLIRRQEETEKRLARIEAAMKHEPIAQESFAPEPVVHEAVPPPIPVAAPPVYTPPMPPPMPQYMPAPPPPQAERKPSVVFETLVGLNWLNVAGVITAIIGVAFIFKYAIDNNYIGPGGRVAIGIVAGLIALLFGDRMWTKGQKVFGQGITGLGLALMYMSFWAAFGLYHLIPQPAAFVLMVATTAASVVFAMRYDSQAIAVIGMLAGYWVPGALSSGEPRIAVLFAYLFLLNTGCLALTRLKGWKSLEYIASVITWLWYMGTVGSVYKPAERPVTTVFGFAFYAQFAFARSRWIWFGAQFIFPAVLFQMWSGDEQLLPLLLLLAAGGLVYADLRQWVLAPSWTASLFWGYFFIWQFTPFKNANPELRFLTLTGAFALFFLWPAWWKVARGRALRVNDLQLLAANAAFYFGASYYLLNPHYHAYMGLLAVAVAAMHLLMAKLLFAGEDRRPAELAIAVTMVFLTLAVPIQFSGFHITVAWALEGAALAWLSERFHSQRINIGASIVLMLVLMRLYSIDAPIASGRFLTFAISAAALFAAAKFIEFREQKLAVYVVAHIVTLSMLGIELVAWIQRNVGKDDQFETSTVAISILMAVYAVMLVTLGVALRSAINRIMGLILMALVVLKLYLADVWELSALFKIIAFLGLAVLLLGVSYLYSRFRPAIAKLWKDDPEA
jgi:hypothetical protein